MSETCYAIFEYTNGADALRGVFPPDNAERALEWAESEFETVHAARIPDGEVGDAYLRKCHGVHIYREENNNE